MDDTNPIPVQPAINEAPDIYPVDIQQLTVEERIDRIETTLNLN